LCDVCVTRGGGASTGSTTIDMYEYSTGMNHDSYYCTYSS